MGELASRVTTCCVTCLLLAGPVGAQPCADSTHLGQLITCRQKSDPQRAGRCASSRSHGMVAPVEGQRRLKFGEPTVYGGKSMGLVFESVGGAPVRAPVSGVVIFAGEFRSYGDLLIVDACNSVAILAGLLSFGVTAGQAVSAGDALATTREPQSGEPVLYLEVRDNNGMPVDPAMLLGED